MKPNKVALAFSLLGVLAAGCADDDAVVDGSLPEGLAEAMAAANAGPIETVRAVDERTAAVLEKQVGANPLPDYQVWVKTGSMDSAGTSARVHLMLCSDDSGRWLCQTFHLDNPGHNDFEKGQRDNFFLNASIGGRVDHIQLQHDDTGDKPGWFVEYVEAWDRRRLIGSFCPINRWLAKTEPPYDTQVAVDCR